MQHYRGWEWILLIGCGIVLIGSLLGLMLAV